MGLKDRRDLKDYVVFIGGGHLAGRVKEVKLPDLEFDTETETLAGVLGTLTIPTKLKELSAELTLKDINTTVMSMFGQRGSRTPIVIRAAARDQSDAVSRIKVTMHGEVNKLESGTWKPGDNGEQKFKIDLHHYRFEDAGTVIHEVDLFNYILIVNGTDLMAAQKAAIGL